MPERRVNYLEPEDEDFLPREDDDFTGSAYQTPKKQLDSGSLQAAIERRTSVIAQRPAEPKPKWWQRLAAGAAGGLAGYVNAGGRTRPIDVGPLTQEILAPGHRRKLSDWMGQVETAEADVKGEQERRAAEMQDLRMGAEADVRKRQAAAADAQLARANRAPTQEPTFQQRFDEAKASGASDVEARVYASGGHLTVPQAERPQTPQKAPGHWAEDRAGNVRYLEAEPGKPNVFAGVGKGIPPKAERQPAGTAGAGNRDDALVETVIRNPEAFNRLTPTAQTRIIPLLEAKGFSGFGKAMTEGAMKQIAESRSAMESLKDLRQTLKDNEQYIGPIAGIQALNPYSDARQAQSKIDLVKQRVGKALEGGVLRKEDEEKYRRILTTLRDTPETAIYKVDNLITTLQRDMQLFEEEQRRGGRNVPGRATGKPAAGGTPKTAEEYLKSIGR